MDDEILNDADLAKLWKIEGTPEAIAKRFKRLRDLPKNNPRHLKSIKIGNQVRYKRSDCNVWIDKNVKHFTASLSFADFTDDDLEELDPAAGLGEKPNYP
jgi:hypothetical protein